MTVEEKEKKLIEVFGEFPHRINIMLSRKDGEYSITFQKFKKDKIQLKNIKFD